MSWFAPVVNAHYSRPVTRRSGACVNLSKGQVAEVKRALSGLRRYSHERAEVIRHFSIKFGCYEGTIRRAFMRRPK